MKNDISKSSSDLIDIIDTRINQIINEKRFLVKHSGVVVSVDTDNKYAVVNISGYDTKISLLNKTGEALSVGDNVYVESASSSLTGAYISERFGETVLNEGGLKSLFNVGTSPPSDTKLFWVDTTVANAHVLKYFNGSAWIAIAGTWGG